MLNQRIKELRNGLNISQVDLGKKLGVTKQCISNWENDNIQPSIDMLIKISKFFGVSTDYLLGIDSKKTLDVSMLSDDQASHIRLIISDIIKN
ncbi:MAG: helix-turn-helix transcriptional regulator [Clostridiales bacterium]|nr:helix-turn-helix transcriptional regulator [Clostridiales bacterium]